MLLKNFSLQLNYFAKLPRLNSGARGDYLLISSFDWKLCDFEVTHPGPIHPMNGLMLLRSRWCVGYEMLLLHNEGAPQECVPNFSARKHVQTCDKHKKNVVGASN